MNSKLKISELFFFSIQGEGRYTGVPSIFLRTFGCNFSCKGFGMPKGEFSIEADNIAKRIGEFSEYKQLPLVSTGCDSFASWHPAFKHLSPMVETDYVAEAIAQVLPNQTWGDAHLVITGGEPLLGWQRSYPDLLNHPKMHGLKEITFETNGTQKLSVDLYNYLQGWKASIGSEVTFSVSPKLSCSGESPIDAIKPAVVCEYENVGYTYLKFVVATEEDAKEALEAIDKYRSFGFRGPVYLMPVGGTTDTYFMNNKRVAELAMANGLRYSPRLQVDLFKNGWGT